MIRSNLSFKKSYLTCLALIVISLSAFSQKTPLKKGPQFKTNPILNKDLQITKDSSQAKNQVPVFSYVKPINEAYKLHENLNINTKLPAESIPRTDFTVKPIALNGTLTVRKPYINTLIENKATLFTHSGATNPALNFVDCFCREKLSTEITLYVKAKEGEKFLVALEAYSDIRLEVQSEGNFHFLKPTDGRINADLVISAQRDGTIALWVSCANEEKTKFNKGWSFLSFTIKEIE